MGTSGRGDVGGGTGTGHPSGIWFRGVSSSDFLFQNSLWLVSGSWGWAKKILYPVRTGRGRQKLYQHRSKIAKCR